MLFRSILSYKQGKGKVDTVLGFPLSYSHSINNTVADITFDNSFDNDTFTYVSGTKLLTDYVNLGYIRQNLNLTDFVKRNVSEKVVEPTKQYQVFSNIYTGKTNYFEVDVLPVDTKCIPNTKGFVNNTMLTSAQYSYQKVFFLTHS